MSPPLTGPDRAICAVASAWPLLQVTHHTTHTLQMRGISWMLLLVQHRAAWAQDCCRLHALAMCSKQHNAGLAPMVRGEHDTGLA
jgi:hypothetical protein